MGSGRKYAAALRELLVVHRLEQARLLRESSLLRCHANPFGRLYVALPKRRPADGPRVSDHMEWRDACRDELATARADAAPVHALLPRLLATPLDRWSTASRLARAALALERCHAGRLDLARALTAERNPGAAVSILQALLEEEPCEGLRAQTLEALALAFESAGDARSSLTSYEAAIGARRSDLRVAVSLLALALRSGDGSRAELAAWRLSRLDLSVPGARARFQRALRQASERAGAELRARGQPTEIGNRGGSPIQERIRSFAREGQGAAAEVARSLL